VRLALRSDRETRIIPAGISVISSHPARNVSGSRAQSTSASIRTKRPISTAIARPRGPGSRYRDAKASVGAPTRPSIARKKAVRPSIPNRGSRALLKLAP